MAEIKVGKTKLLTVHCADLKELPRKPASFLKLENANTTKNLAFSAKRNPKPQENVNPDNGGACVCQLKIS